MDVFFFKVVIHLELYKTSKQAILNQNVDSLSIGYKYKKDNWVFYLGNRFAFSLNNMMNTLDFEYMSKKYNKQLAKQAKLGYGIYIPSFDESNVKFSVLKYVKYKLFVDNILLDLVDIVNDNWFKNFPFVESYFFKIRSKNLKRMEIWYNQTKETNTNYFVKNYIKNIDYLLFNKYINNFTKQNNYKSELETSTTHFIKIYSEKGYYKTNHISSILKLPSEYFKSSYSINQAVSFSKKKKSTNENISNDKYFKGLFYDTDSKLMNKLLIDKKILNTKEEDVLSQEDIFLLNLSDLYKKSKVTNFFISYPKYNMSEINSIAETMMK